MKEHNQEEYRTLDWIMAQSEKGIYLVVAEEAVQEEIVDCYKGRKTGIYDYKINPGAYSFQILQKQITGMPEMPTFLIANFQLAVQSQEDLGRLNFSRDMLAGLEKNLIFLITPYGDHMLASGAYDFYSFVKLRVIFQESEKEEEKELVFLDLDKKVIPCMEEFGRREEARLNVRKGNALIEFAKEETEHENYQASIRWLWYGIKILEKQLGADYPELARPYGLLADAYQKASCLQEAENCYTKAISIRKMTEENHPDTAAFYQGLAGLYETQGKYQEAENLYQKALAIYQDAGLADAQTVSERLENLNRKRGIKK